VGAVVSITVGSDSVSVYALSSDPVAEATAFFNTQLGAAATAWAAATSDNRKRALAAAARWIDRSVVFSGTKTVASQPREWPRDGATCDGEAITDGTTPDEVAYGEFELAGAILVSSSIVTSSSTGSNVRRVKAGSAEVEFFSQTIGTDQDTRLPLPAWDYLKCLLGTLSEGSAGQAYGTNECSAFGNTKQERTRGFS